jgi:hypothetical protein
VLSFLNTNPAIVALCTLMVSIGLVIVGWQVLYNNARRLASRNETYSFVSQVLSLLDELLKESIIYWSSSETELNGQLQSKKLASKTQRFKKKLGVLTTRGLQLDCNRELRGIRRAITLDAERPTTVSNLAKMEKIEDIDLFGAELTSKVLTAYQNKYPMS